MDTLFTPWRSLAGGMLIGLAAVLLMAANGRIAGISGIVSRLLPPAEEDAARGEGFAFLAGLLLALPVWMLSGAGTPPLQVTVGLPLLVAAGALVGFGSVLGNGCTSGHGVCGLARRSRRSLVATATFVASAVLTVYVLRHVLGA